MWAFKGAACSDPVQLLQGLPGLCFLSFMIKALIPRGAACNRAFNKVEESEICITTIQIHVDKKEHTAIRQSVLLTFLI